MARRFIARRGVLVSAIHSGNIASSVTTSSLLPASAAFSTAAMASSGAGCKAVSHTSNCNSTAILFNPRLVARTQKDMNSERSSISRISSFVPPKMIASPRHAHGKGQLKDTIVMRERVACLDGKVSEEEQRTASEASTSSDSRSERRTFFRRNEKLFGKLSRCLEAVMTGEDVIVVFTDGASRGNPGKAAVGIVIEGTWHSIFICNMY